MSYTVMLLSGDEPLLERLERSLEPLPVRAVRASSLMDGISKFHFYSPDLVILSYKLKGASGGTAVREIRKRFPERQIPVWMIVNSTQKLFMRTNLDKRARPDQYLEIPIEAIELAERVEQLRSQAESSPGSDEAPVSALVSDIASDLLDTNGGSGASADLPEKGTFKDCSFPGLLHKIRECDYTGAVDISAGPQSMKIFFGSGAPIAVESGYIADLSLGSLLMADGKLSMNQHRSTLARASREKRFHGEVLIEDGILSHLELKSYLTVQTFNKICRVFSFPPRSTRFAKQAGIVPSERCFIAQHDTGRLIVKGVRDHFPEERLTSIFEKRRRMDRPVAFSKSSAYQVETLGFTSEEERIIAKINGSLSVKQLCQVTGRKESKVYKPLYALLVMRVVKFGEPPD